MKSLKKISFIRIMLIIMAILIYNSQNYLYINSSAVTEKQVNVGVLLYKFDDPYISLVKQSLENIQRKNETKVKFTFFDARNNQAIQNETLDTLLRNNIDLLIINLVNTKADVIENTIDKVKPYKIPLILLGAEPSIITPKIEDYKKFIILSSDAKQSGILEGKAVVNEWNKHKSIIDKNKDNIMQYIMLKGERDNMGSIDRTTYSISTIKNAGIEIQELASIIANWDQGLAKDAIESLLLKYGDRIEVIISNNDSMAIGAIEALQKYGYNKGNPAKTIPVFGIDAIPAAQDLIKKGFMAGTVIQDTDTVAEALYTIGMNLVSNTPPLEGTDYKFDETGIIVRLPYSEYTP